MTENKTNQQKDKEESDDLLEEDNAIFETE